MIKMIRRVIAAWLFIRIRRVLGFLTHKSGGNHQPLFLSDEDITNSRDRFAQEWAIRNEDDSTGSDRPMQGTATGHTGSSRSVYDPSMPPDGQTLENWFPYSRSKEGKDDYSPYQLVRNWVMGNPDKPYKPVGPVNPVLGNDNTGPKNDFPSQVDESQQSIHESTGTDDRSRVESSVPFDYQAGNKHIVEPDVAGNPSALELDKAANARPYSPTTRPPESLWDRRIPDGRLTEDGTTTLLIAFGLLILALLPLGFGELNPGKSEFYDDLALLGDSTTSLTPKAGPSPADITEQKVLRQDQFRPTSSEVSREEKIFRAPVSTAIQESNAEENASTSITEDKRTNTIREAKQNPSKHGNDIVLTKTLGDKSLGKSDITPKAIAPEITYPLGKIIEIEDVKSETANQRLIEDNKAKQEESSEEGDPVVTELSKTPEPKAQETQPHVEPDTEPGPKELEPEIPKEHSVIIEGSIMVKEKKGDQAGPKEDHNDQVKLTESRDGDQLVSKEGGRLEGEMEERDLFLSP